MKSCFPEVFEEVVRRSANECFKGSRETLPPIKAPPQVQLDDSHVAGRIEFTGQVEGCLVLISTFDVIAKMRLSGVDPASLSKNRAGDWILIRDCAGELANQFVGRVKNRLRGFGIRFDVGSPTALSGRALLASGRKYLDGRTVAFGRGGDTVHVVIKITREPPLASVTPAAENPAMPKEGDLLLL
jgi:CheY-specific phosphatase CheX